MMSTHDLMLASVLDQLDDDLVRLAYADVLLDRDDVGDRERAEFIRIQLELATPEQDRIAILESFPKDSATVASVPGALELLARRTVLLGRQGELWLRWGHAWSEHLTPALKTGTVKLDWWRRGFVERIRCRTSEWRRSGRRLVRNNPLREVRLMDRKPRLTPTSDGSRCFVWQRGRRAEQDAVGLAPIWLNSFLFGVDRSIKPFDTAEEAIAALSEGCLQWARRA